MATRPKVLVNVNQPRKVRCPVKCLQIEHEGAIRGTWVARVPADHTPEDVLGPHYFGDTLAGTKGLRVGDIIEIEPESAAWNLSVRVMAIILSTSTVVTRLKGEIANYEEEFPEGYSCKWHGDSGRWSLYRGDLVMESGFYTQTDALWRLEDLARSGAA